MPKIVDHAARRTEIVHGLWAVIYTSGIDSVSFRSVAEASGISIGRVQHYFPSRRELILEGCRQMVAGAQIAETGAANDENASGDVDGRTAENLDEDGTGEASPSAVENLRQFLHAFIPQGESMRLGASVWHTYVARAVADPQIAEIILETNRATHQMARNRCAEVIEAAAANTDSNVADRHASRLVALATGLAQEVMLDVRSAESAMSLLDEDMDSLTQRG